MHRAHENNSHCLNKGPDNLDVERPPPVPVLIYESVRAFLVIHEPNQYTYSPTDNRSNLGTDVGANCINRHRTAPYHETRERKRAHTTYVATSEFGNIALTLPPATLRNAAPKYPARNRKTKYTAVGVHRSITPGPMIPIHQGRTYVRRKRYWEHSHKEIAE